MAVTVPFPVTGRMTLCAAARVPPDDTWMPPPLCGRPSGAVSVPCWIAIGPVVDKLSAAASVSPAARFRETAAARHRGRIRAPLDWSMTSVPLLVTLPTFAAFPCNVPWLIVVAAKGLCARDRQQSCAELIDRVLAAKVAGDREAVLRIDDVEVGGVREHELRRFDGCRHLR